MRKLVVALTLGLALVLVCASQALAWTWPADGNVVRVFAFGDDPYAAGQHRGVDIALPTGADVRAPTAGVVTFAGFVPSGGTTLSLATDAGLVVTLQQLGSLAVGKGATVSEGEIVGSGGSSSDGTTVESHVHLGIRVASDRHGYIDPLSVLPGRGASTGAPPPEVDELAALVEPSESLPESSDEQAGAASADPGEATQDASAEEAVDVATESAPLDAPSSPSGPADRVDDASATEFGVHEAPPTDHHAESSLEDEPAQVADEQIQSTVSVGDAASAAPSAPSATGAHEVDTGDAKYESLGRAIVLPLHEPAPAESEPAAGSTSPGTGPPTVDAPLDPALEPQPVELTQPATTSEARGPAPGDPSSTGAAPVEQGVTASRAPSPLTTAEPKSESATPVDVDSAPSPKPAVAEAPSAEVQIPPLAAPASAAAANAAQITSVLPMWSGPSRPAPTQRWRGGLRRPCERDCLTTASSGRSQAARATGSACGLRHRPGSRQPAPPRCSCSRWLRSWRADRDACSAISAQRFPRRS